MTTESMQESRYMLESYQSGRDRLYAHACQLERQYQEEKQGAEREKLARRLVTLYGELEEIMETIRTLRKYCGGGIC